MRTQKEIVQRIEDRKKNDQMGFEIDEYVIGLDYEHITKYVQLESNDEKNWTPMTKEKILENAKNYMEFAYGKAYDERGISANRSIMHYIAWMWLLEENELTKKIESMFENNYHNYGIPILNMICDHFGWEKC